VKRRLLQRASTLAGCAAAALLGAVILASPASAHATLLSTVPVTSGHVASAPTAVVLNYDEHPQGRYSTIHVTGPDGQRRDSGPVRVVNDAVTESLGGSRPAGMYVVDWRVISADGHPVSGQFSFTADAAGAALPAREVVSTTAKGGSSSTGIVIAVVVVVLLLLTGLLFFLRRRRPPQDGTRSSVSWEG
jgi:methionine-rich copper-binding protein CopC